MSRFQLPIYLITIYEIVNFLLLVNCVAIALQSGDGIAALYHDR